MLLHRLHAFVHLGSHAPDLFGVLGATRDGSQPQALYLQMRDTVRRLLDAPSFAVLLTSGGQGEPRYAYAERDGHLDTEATTMRGSMR